MFHRHRFTPVAVTTLPRSAVETPYTEVLFRCPCSEIRTRQIRGAWTVADVAGESAQGTPAPAPAGE